MLLSSIDMPSIHSGLYKIFRAFYPHQDPGLIKRKYGIPEAINLNFTLKPNGWFIVTSPDLPGLVTEAKTQDELVLMVNDAVLTYFDVPKKEADIIYNQFNIGNQMIQYTGQLVTKAA